MKNKGNDGTGNIPERDLWETNQKLWDGLDKQYNFTFDCCANNKNNKCYLFASDFGNPLIQKHILLVPQLMLWMNPPFSKAYEMFKHFFNMCGKGIAIYRCDNMETKVWQEIILKNADWVFIPKGRICYEGMPGKGSRFPSALIGKNVEPIKNMEGVTLFLKNE